MLRVIYFHKGAPNAFERGYIEAVVEKVGTDHIFADQYGYAILIVSGSTKDEFEGLAKKIGNKFPNIIRNIKSD